MKKAKDPVCNMEVDKSKTTPHTDYDSKSYYFCSEDCKDKFEQDPKSFVHKEVA